MSYALFLGCVVPAREPSYEVAVRKVFKALGVNLVDLEGATCCAPIPVESLSFKTSLSIAAYNLALAEEADLDLVMICNGCFQVLARAHRLLKEDEELRAKVNGVLAEVGKEFRGNRDVRDYLQVLHGDIGLEKLRGNVSKPLRGLRAAAFYGCHVLKPSDVLKFDDPERPRVLDELIGAAGAESIPYLHKTRCCGGLLRGISDDIARKLARDKLFTVSQAKADCVVTICPFCFLQLDLGQLEVNRHFKESFNVPVLHYPELLGLAMGMSADELGLKTHRVSTEPVLGKMK